MVADAQRLIVIDRELSIAREIQSSILPQAMPGIPNCVLFTAADAYMREFRLVVPRDCIGAKTPDALRRALKMMVELFGATTGVSHGLRLSGRR